MFSGLNFIFVSALSCLPPLPVILVGAAIWDASPLSEIKSTAKDEDWSGEFVDLKEDQVVPDRSVLNVIPQVGFLIF